MTLFFLKIKAEIYYPLLVFLLFNSGILANDSIPDPLFKEHCNTSDAYLLYSYTDVTYTKSWGFYNRHVTVQSKLVVNNRSGVEEHAFLNLSDYLIRYLKVIQIKTLKADGSVLKLDSSLVFKHRSNYEQPGEINYPIPGVEPGDTIETYYMYTESLKSYELMDFVNLYRDVPSLNTEYTVKTAPDHIVRYKKYNGFQEPQILSNDSLVYCVFKKENVYGLSENKYTCLPCELPYIYYSIDKQKSKVRTWKNVYNQEFNYITQPMSLDYEKSSYYKRWKRRIIGEAGDSSKYYKFKLLHTDIINNTQMEPNEIGELTKSSGYFLKEKRFDPISVRRLYRQLLEDLEIEYWAVFARSKRVGNIDPFYIRKGEFDHIFFAYEKNKGSLNLLYPHNISYKYQINEIPTSLYNTEAVIVRPFIRGKIKKSDKFINDDFKMAEVDSVTVNLIKLPGMTANHNYLKQVIYCKVDLKEKNTTFKSQISISGGLFTDVRSFYSLLQKDTEMNDFYDALTKYEGDENALDIDTITKRKLMFKKPFTYNVSSEGSLKNTLSFLNDSMVSITLNNLIQHSRVECEQDSMDLNFYLDYSYSDICTVLFIFPCDIDVLSIAEYNTNFKSSFGEYLFDIKRSGNNQLFIQSNYKIIKDKIPKDDYKKLMDLNQLVKETKNMRLLIKLLNTSQQK